MARRNYILQGTGEMRRKLARLGEIAKQVGSARVMRKRAFDLLREAQDLIPVDTGALKNSGKVRVKNDAGKQVFSVVFGDEKVDYAQIVHEDLLAKHSVGQALYLKIPFNRARDELRSDVRRRLRMAFT